MLSKTSDQLGKWFELSSAHFVSIKSASWKSSHDGRMQLSGLAGVRASPVRPPYACRQAARAPSSTRAKGLSGGWPLDLYGRLQRPPGGQRLDGRLAGRAGLPENEDVMRCRLETLRDMQSLSVPSSAKVRSYWPKNEVKGPKGS